MNNEIESLINKYETKGDFNYATVSNEMISVAEKKLSVKLPEQYTSFVKRFGQGGIGGVEILGVGLTGKLIFVETTLEYRYEGLPNNLVIVENVDEYFECIDCNTGKIVSWDMIGGIIEDYQNFDEYILDRMKDAIGNL